MNQIKRFVRYYAGHKVLFAMDMFCALLMAIADLFYPMITRNIMNDYIPNRQLRLILPPEESNDFCHRIVLFGREVCTARKPKCDECPLAIHCQEVNKA